MQVQDLWDVVRGTLRNVLRLFRLFIYCRIVAFNSISLYEAPQGDRNGKPKRLDHVLKRNPLQVLAFHNSVSKAFEGRRYFRDRANMLMKSMLRNISG